MQGTPPLNPIIKFGNYRARFIRPFILKTSQV
jgi:hypothetical protein